MSLSYFHHQGTSVAPWQCNSLKLRLLRLPMHCHPASEMVSCNSLTWSVTYLIIHESQLSSLSPATPFGWEGCSDCPTLTQPPGSVCTCCEAMQPGMVNWKMYRLHTLTTICFSQIHTNMLQDRAETETPIKSMHPKQCLVICWGFLIY